MKKILAVGIAALDIVNITNGFPEEDAEKRVLQQIVQRGGNACNTLAVLSQYKHHCFWAGTLADDDASQLIVSDLVSRNIDIQYTKRITKTTTPTSYIILNQENGSRTIVHYRDLPEYDEQAFFEIDFSKFDWLHFEARNIESIERMLQKVHAQKNRVPISIEVEKVRDDEQKLFPYADIIMFSKNYAQSQGFAAADSFLQSMHEKLPNIMLTCTWGEKGAAAIGPESVLLEVPAATLSQVVDSIGAGDTFNAGVIHSLLMGDNLQQSVEKACVLATKKCQQYGFDQLL